MLIYLYFRGDVKHDRKRMFFFKKRAVLHGGITQDRIVFIIDEQQSKIAAKNSKALKLLYT